MTTIPEQRLEPIFRNSSAAHED